MNPPGTWHDHHGTTIPVDDPESAARAANSVGAARGIAQSVESRHDYTYGESRAYWRSRLSVPVQRSGNL